MAIAMILYMDRRFRIDKVALEFQWFLYTMNAQNQRVCRDLAVFARGNQNGLFHTDN